MSLPFPSAEEGRELHRRLSEADPSITKVVCERYSGPLCDFLQDLHPSVDEHDCITAANDALLAFMRRPERFDPDRLDLAAFLRMVAKRRLYNLWRASAGRRRRTDGDFPVEEAAHAGNPSGNDPVALLVRREEADAARRRVEAVHAGCTESECVVLEAMIADERSSARTASLMGLGHLPEREQRREVKRVKDRLGKRIERGGGANDGPFG